MIYPPLTDAEWRVFITEERQYQQDRRLAYRLCYALRIPYPRLS